MTKKPGRNDPCPCGSGKKYKKCCGLGQSQGGYVQAPESWIPPSERTGTIWDDYMDVIPIIAVYAKKIMDFDEDGREFKKVVSAFEKRFRPGEDDGVMDSVFMSWMYFDLRFGKSLETVAERFLADSMASELMEPGPTFIRHLSESYLTFFEIISYSPEADTVTVEELRTGRRFEVFHARLLLDIEPGPGEIWYARRVGTPNRSIFFTTPYIFEPESRASFKRAVRIQERDFSLGPRAKIFPPDRYFAESQKETAPFWIEYILRGRHPSIFQAEEEEVDFDVKDEHYPILVTTDGEEFVLTEIRFRIKDEAGLRKRLSKLRSFEYDEREDSWIWHKAKSRKSPDKPRTVLGHFRIEGSSLVAETNSRERASRLRSKLKGHLGNLIAYEKTLYQDPYDFPELSPDEIEARNKRSEELNAIPEVREAIKKQLEHHYFNEWPNTKLPALGGLTPLQAVKRKNERFKVVALLEDFERFQNSPAKNMPKINLDKLRRLLGLPPKTS
ncbi:MAG: SEC-C domain-containing protein [Candidatus Aminicenantes bacterium]|nr:SEC-C domain-containing protein [Candidatus Aminicenantes bacterium]